MENSLVLDLSPSIVYVHPLLQGLQTMLRFYFDKNATPFRYSAAKKCFAKAFPLFGKQVVDVKLADETHKKCSVAVKQHMMYYENVFWDGARVEPFNNPEYFLFEDVQRRGDYISQLRKDGDIVPATQEERSEWLKSSPIHLDVRWKTWQGNPLWDDVDSFEMYYVAKVEEV